jgi:F0F1-type ATP synthase assembly protein I
MSRIGLLTTTLATAEPMLVAVVGLLILVIVGLVAMALLVRRRSKVVEDTTSLL